MNLINTIPFLRRHFSERLLDSISFTVREANLSRQLMIVRYTIVRKCLFTQWTSPLSLDEDVLYIETQSLPLFIVDMFTLPTNARWSQNGVTVAGGNEVWWCR